MHGRQERNVSVCGVEFFQHRAESEGTEQSHNNRFKFHMIICGQILEGLRKQ